VPRRNRVDPAGDLHAVAARGMFTGNRRCLVDDCSPSTAGAVSSVVPAQWAAPDEHAGFGLSQLPSAFVLEGVVVAADRREVIAGGGAAVGVVLVGAAGRGPAADEDAGAVADLDVAAQRGAGEAVVGVAARSWIRWAGSRDRCCWWTSVRTAVQAPHRAGHHARRRRG
jgi:hypothetical protein